MKQKSLSLALSLSLSSLLLLLSLGGGVVVGEGTTWYVDSSANDGKGTVGDPYGSFRQAFEVAESGDTILAAGGTYSGSDNMGFELTSDGVAQISFGPSGTNGDEPIIIDLTSDTPTPFLTAKASSSSTGTIITSFKFINSPSGFVLDLESTKLVSLEYCTFEDNNLKATEASNAIRLKDTEIYIHSCDFINNYSPFMGAAGYLENVEGNIIGNNFIGNSVAKVEDGENGTGGALYITGYSVSSFPDFQNCSFINNTAFSGGAVKISNSTDSSFVDTENDLFQVITFTDCIFDNNMAGNYEAGGKGGGGAIYSFGFVSFYGCYFTNNFGDFGGALAFVGRFGLYWVPVMNGTHFIGNTAIDSGGAFYLTSPTGLTIVQSTFENNTAIANLGGALYVANNDSMSISETTFRKNTAQHTTHGYGGALAIGGSNAVSLRKNCVFDKNYAGNRGGAVFTTFAISAEYTSFTDNVASGLGGAIYAESQHANNVKHCTLTGNTAQRGGAVYVLGHETSIYSAFVRCVIQNNTADKSGGALSLYLTSPSSLEQLQEEQPREIPREVEPHDFPFNPLLSLHIYNNHFINNEVRVSGGVGGAVEVGGEGGSGLRIVVWGNNFDGNSARGGGNDIHAARDGDESNKEQIVFFNNTFSDEDVSSGPYDLYFQDFPALFEKTCNLPRVGLKDMSPMFICACDSFASLDELALISGYLTVDASLSVERLDIQKGNITYIDSAFCNNNTESFVPYSPETNGDTGVTLVIGTEGAYDAKEGYIFGMDVSVSAGAKFTFVEGAEMFVDGGNFINEGTVNISQNTYLGDQRLPFTLTNNGILNFENTTTIHGNLSLGHSSKITMSYPKGLQTSPEQLVKIIGIADLAGSNTIDFGEVVLSEEGMGLVMTWNNYTGGFHSFYMDTNTDKTIAKEETETNGLYVRTIYNHSGNVSVGAVIGIVMGGLVVVVMLVGAWYYFKNKGSGGYDTIV